MKRSFVGGVFGSMAGMVLYSLLMNPNAIAWAQLTSFVSTTRISPTAAVRPSASVNLSAAFNYQGQLKKNGVPVTATCAMTFSLWDAANGGSQIGGNQIVNNVAVSGGLFTVQLNGANQFGVQPFDGQARWLQAAVQCPGDAGPTALSRQPLTAVPYAISLMPGAYVAGNAAADMGAHFAYDAGGGTGMLGVYGWGNIGLYGNGVTDGVVGASTSGYGVKGTSASSYGVYGYSANDNGVHGQSTNNTGVAGDSTTGFGVYGHSASSNGVVGESTDSYGVEGISNGSYGVKGTSANSYGVYGYSANDNGVHGQSVNNTGVAGDSVGGVGVYGHSISDTAVYGQSENRIGVQGDSTLDGGVYGNNTGDGAGVVSFDPITLPGVLGYSLNGAGVEGRTTNGVAGLFYGQVDIASGLHSQPQPSLLVQGPVTVTGYLAKQGGGFVIDDPLDPANKLLNHSFVEFPDMKNIYDGVVTLDANGQAIVNLPDYFQALNQDFRYQLTSIGAPAPNLYVAQEVQNNQFKIAGGKPGMKVSWQVTGIRRDPWAQQNQRQPEVDKTGQDRGTFLDPQGYGQPESNGMYYRQTPSTPNIANQ